MNIKSVINFLNPAAPHFRTIIARIFSPIKETGIFFRNFGRNFPDLDRAGVGAQVEVCWIMEVSDLGSNPAPSLTFVRPLLFSVFAILFSPSDFIIQILVIMILINPFPMVPWFYRNHDLSLGKNLDSLVVRVVA